MDILTLKRYSLDLPQNKRETTHRRMVNSFIEFYINDQLLSSLLDSSYSGNRKSVLENNVGVLGSFENIPLEIVKIKQLLGKKFADADFIELQEGLTTNIDESYVADVIDCVKDELAEPEILIYCCAACGDYLCGGVTVDVCFEEENVTWTFADGESKTVFVFDKYSYLGTLKSYLTKIKYSLSKR